MKATASSFSSTAYKMSFFDDFADRLANYKEFIIIGMCFVLILAHSKLKKRDWIFIVMSTMFVVLAIFGFTAEMFFFPNQTVRFWQFVTLLVAYGTGMYIIICDVLIFGAAKYFNGKWGDKWTKALDYPYLVLACVGVLASINRLDVITERVSGLDILGPLVVTTAVVIRFVKTRAEISEWNKPDFHNS